ncbi:MAG: hypothetical protein NTV30_01345, partial [Chloroflexi bacterium]|nr:hypothetical protein [Chloroflexota bacterium]
MSIEVRITAPVLQEIVKGQEVVQVTSADTFNEALNKLDAKFPGLKKKMYKSGEIDPTLDV